MCGFFFLMIRRPPRSTQGRSSAASDVYKRQGFDEPLGERLVKAGVIGKTQLKRALDAQRRSPDGARLGHVLLEGGDIDRETLEQAVREQIEDSVFTFFGWPDGEFQFGADESPSDEDILVELNVEHVIMEGCRRIDEWELIFQQLGSMERVPRLAYSDHVEEEGGLTLTAEEWRVVVHIDGHADINTILHECGLDRFRGAKVMYSLFSSGLVTVSEPVIEGIGRTLSVAVRGPIDTYNEVFISTLTDSDTVKQLRVETIDETEVEIPVLAGQMPANGNGDGGDGEDAAAQDVLVFTVSSASPEEAWRRLAAESSAWVLLANANDVDSLRSTRADLQFVKRLGDVPYVVAPYMSMAGEELSRKQIVRTLGLDGSETFDITGLADGAAKTATVTATKAGGSTIAFEAKVLLLTPKEVEYFRHGGLLQYVLRQLAARKARNSLLGFTELTNPQYRVAAHHRLIAHRLEQLERGEIDRLMIFMPPRHGKSETVSRLFSAYYLLRHPERWVGLTSYAEGLAFTLSRNARNNYQQGGGALSQQAFAVSHWETGRGGGMWAAGVGVSKPSASGTSGSFLPSGEGMASKGPSSRMGKLSTASHPRSSNVCSAVVFPAPDSPVTSRTFLMPG